jgi:hypothetical protein
MASCFWSFKQVAPMVLAFALLKAGSSIPARIAMIAITTSNSIRVKADEGSLEGRMGFMSF